MPTSDVTNGRDQVGCFEMKSDGILLSDGTRFGMEFLPPIPPLDSCDQILRGKAPWMFSSSFPPLCRSKGYLGVLVAEIGRSPYRGYVGQVAVEELVSIAFERRILCWRDCSWSVI